MTRILCVTANYPPHHTGGYEVSCRDVMEGLASRGHDVTVLTSDDRLPGVSDPTGERNANPAVRRDIRRYFRDDQLWEPSWRERWKVERDNQRAISNALAGSRPDVVAIWHVGAFSLGIVTAILRSEIPVVYAVCDDWLAYCTELDQWIKPLRHLGPLAPALETIVRVPTSVPDLANSGPICFVSEMTRRRAERHRGLPYPDSSVVHSGVDLKLFTPRRSEPEWRWRLMYAGRFDPRKGVETAVRALAHLPAEATLRMCGWGDAEERARLNALAAELGVAGRITFEQVAREDLPDRYRSADAYIFPSEWEEPFGLVPLEAMACGVPVAGTGTGGSADFLIHERNCLRFAPGDSVGLAAAVTRLAGDPELRARLVAAGLKTAEFFAVEHLVDTFEAWYVGAVDRFRDGRPPDRPFVAGEVLAGA